MRMQPGLLALALLPLLGAGGGQQVVNTGNHRHVFSSGSCPFTDSFSGSGAMGSAWATWNSKTGMQQFSGYAAGTSFGTSGVVATSASCSFPEDQYAQLSMSNFGAVSNADSIFVLMSTSGNGYGFLITPGFSTTLSKYTSGTASTLVVCTLTPTLGHVYKLAVTGSGGGQTLTAYDNGSAISGCTTTDSAYTSGYPGFAAVSGSGSSAHFNSFQAD